VEFDSGQRSGCLARVCLMALNQPRRDGGKESGNFDLPVPLRLRWSSPEVIWAAQHWVSRLNLRLPASRIQKRVWTRYSIANSCSEEILRLPG